MNFFGIVIHFVTYFSSVFKTELIRYIGDGTKGR
jgi:hypothetical protein